ncbi:MAG: hypothetical protein AAFO75_02035 [Pseudomonadota bacterium]
MQIRLLRMRSHDASLDASTLSRMLNQLTTPLFGGHSMDASDEAMNREIAHLQMDNERLAQAGCKTFDLDYEMAEKDMSKTPRPR